MAGNAGRGVARGLKGAAGMKRGGVGMAKGAGMKMVGTKTGSKNGFVPNSRTVTGAKRATKAAPGKKLPGKAVVQGNQKGY